MFNRTMCFIIILIISIGFFIKYLFGLLFISSSLLWILSLLYYVYNSFDNNLSKKNITDIFVKSIYITLTLLIYFFEYKSTEMITSGVIFIILLILDLLCLKLKYKFKEIDSSTFQNQSKTVQKIINLRHSHFIIGKKESLFGDHKIEKYIRALSWISISTVAVILFSILSVALGKIVDINHQVENTVLSVIVVIMGVFLSILYTKSFSFSETNCIFKTMIKTFSLLGVIVLFFPSLLVQRFEILSLLGVDLFLYLIGIGMNTSLVYTSMKLSRWYNQKICQLDSE